jgi:hypothetical protein
LEVAISLHLLLYPPPFLNVDIFNIYITPPPFLHQDFPKGVQERRGCKKRKAPASSGKASLFFSCNEIIRLPLFEGKP